MTLDLDFQDNNNGIDFLFNSDDELEVSIDIDEMPDISGFSANGLHHFLVEGDQGEIRHIDADDLKTFMADGFEANSDNQTLNLNGTSLSISGGNSVTLPPDQFEANTDNQQLTKSGNNISLQNGGSVLDNSLSVADANFSGSNNDRLIVTGSNFLTVQNQTGGTNSFINFITTGGTPQLQVGSISGDGFLRIGGMQLRDFNSSFGSSLNFANTGNGLIEIGGTDAITINQGGDVTIEHDLVVDGSFTPSDQRLKKDVSDYSRADVDKFYQVRPVSYKWIEASKGDQVHHGFIAQELEMIYPELVKTGSDGYKSVAYTEMIAMITDVIQAHRSEIDQIKKREIAMQYQINSLMDDIAELKK